MSDDKSLMTFPCEFQIKIIGDHKESFALEIAAITLKHFPETNESSIRSQVSKNGNFLSLTVSVYVCDQASLDALYQELTKHPDTKMVL